MKRFFRFDLRILLFAAIAATLILLGALLMEIQSLKMQVDELTARVPGLEQEGQAGPGSG